MSGAFSTGRTGGEILVAALRAHGCDRIFGVPGESYLPLLDALYGREDIAFVTCRHEAGAANMAEADAKLTGRMGLCAVSRGPGAMHTAIGLHTAEQDSTPLMLLVGQVPSTQRGLGAFQEVDFERLFDPVAKFVAEIADPADIPAVFAQAWRAAMTGRRGPVVLSLPEDMLEARADVADLPPEPIAPLQPSQDAMSDLAARLAEARKPLLIVGGSGWDAQACADILRFAERQDLPVAAGFRCQDIVSTRHDHYVGELGFAPAAGLLQHVAASDLLVVVGERLGDVCTQGYTLLERPTPRQPLVHVYPEPLELGRVYQPTLAIPADMAAFARTAAELPRTAPDRSAWRNCARRDYLAHQAIPAPRRRAGYVDMAEVMGHLRERLPADAIVTNGAGNYTGWVGRFHRYDGFRTQLAPVSGAMGYGLPAAIAAKLRHPERTVLAFAGDGCFTMAMTELATARQLGLGVIVIVVNNALYGSIAMHQQKHFPGRSIGVRLGGPDFAAIARGFGMAGETATDIETFTAAFDRALASGEGTVIELRTDPRLITPTAELSAI